VNAGPGDSLDIRCPECGGVEGGCGVCEGRCSIEVTGCPLHAVTPDVWDMLNVIDAWDGQKIPPVAGGYHDQTECFLQSLRFVKAEESRVRRRQDARRRAAL
jgi:hypothetical protein